MFNEITKKRKPHSYISALVDFHSGLLSKSNWNLVMLVFQAGEKNKAGASNKFNLRISRSVWNLSYIVDGSFGL